MEYQKPKGMEDYYPEEMDVRNRVFDSLGDIARKYNFKEVSSPVMESFELLSKKEGEEIRKQIFTLEKRGDEQLGLRFDLTVPNVRMFIEKQKSMPKTVKWFSLERMWRYEQPQKGRQREFYQFNAEIFGSAKPDADAEIVSLAIEALLSLGLKENDFRVYINNRKLLEGLLEDILDKGDIPKVIQLIDKKNKVSKEEFEKELKKLEPKGKVEKISSLLDSSIAQLKKLKINDNARQGLNELEQVISLVKYRNIVFSLSTARGLAYYTGTVFEIFDREGKFRSVAGGGRYDNLVKLFDGQDTPATGFAMGYAVLRLLLEEKKLLPKPSLEPDYYVAIVNEEVKKKAREIVSKLREKYVVETDLTGRNLGNQLQYAGSIGAKKVVIVGPKDLKEKKVTVRDMGSGKEAKVLLSKIL